MRAALLVSAAAAMLTACQTGPETIEETRPTVTYRYTADELADVERQAAAFCERFGLEPRLARTGTQAGERVAQYECR